LNIYDYFSYNESLSSEDEEEREEVDDDEEESFNE